MKDFNKRLNDIQRQLVINQLKDQKDVILIEKLDDGQSKVTINNQEYIVSDTTTFVEDHKEKMKKYYKKYEPSIIDLDIPIYQIMLALGIDKERMTSILKQGDTISLIDELTRELKSYANKEVNNEQKTIWVMKR